MASSFYRVRKVEVFGELAKQIQDGDIYQARVTSVEGRKVVELVHIDDNNMELSK